MRADVSEQSPNVKPTGVPKQSPCYNVATRKRRRFMNRWLGKLATTKGRQALKIELRRRIRHSSYWAKEANQFGLETLIELMLAIFDDLDLTIWQTRHTLEILAERAGLKTHSVAGNSSISRASRGCDRLYWLNLIITAKAPFNPYDARCACKHIEVTEDFFAALGIPLKQVYRERAKLLKAPPEEVISSWDNRLVELVMKNMARMAAAGLERMKTKRAEARQRKKEYYSPTFA
ncbi:putative RepA protein [Xenorhabdus bovienii str. kraussei Becker Underwood]|uniref:Putative RepA protein n=1 Tax=Xenorhabdus bovienii str. kraussei Becker Underwood TaxID=1398204 RepID=A0A077PU49_XENBV|nr:putative RepA protein [Xenorhabdus bovienii str. kraussei Becker Underwood]